MEKKDYTEGGYALIEQTIIEPLREMTDMNYHTEAVLHLAKEVNARRRLAICPEDTDDLLRWMEFIKKEHDRIGHMPKLLCEFRYGILNKLLEHCKVIFGEEVTHDISRAM